MFTAFRRRPTASKEPFVPPTRQQVVRLFIYLRPYGGQMVLATVALLISAALSLVFPWIMQNLVDSVFQKSDAAELNRITLVLLATFLANSIFRFIEGYFLTFVGERVVVDVRRQVYAHLHTLSLRFFADRHVGELISRLASDVTLVRAALTNNVATVLNQTVTFIGSLALMLALNWRLTLLILLLAPVISVSAVLFGGRLRKLSTQVQDQLAEGTANAEEALSGVRIVKAFTREAYEVSRYADQIERTFKATISLAIVRSAFGAFVSFVGFAAMGGLLWFGGREVLAGRLTAGALIAFLVYGINIAASLGAFTALYSQIQEAVGASRRIFELLDEVPEVRDAADASQLPAIRGHIVLENVSFAYPGTDRVLHDINLEIHPGEVLALVGPSGAGKSTLFNLIPRFYDPTQGTVRLEGVDARAVTLLSLRSQMGLVPQETQLFSGTVLENIRYGRLDATPAEVEAAARAANAEEFITRLPQGYETRVGERGVKLSGGQRQRIAIARALLRNPRLLLLDEATSSLDSESEGLVQEALERLMVGRTTLIIAHRLSTVQKAHRIAVLEAGRLVELGTHPELLARDGLYARLYRKQFRD